MFTVVESTVVVVPLIVRFPMTSILLLNFASPVTSRETEGLLVPTPKRLTAYMFELAFKFPMMCNASSTLLVPTPKRPVEVMRALSMFEFTNRITPVLSAVTNVIWSVLVTPPRLPHAFPGPYPSNVLSVVLYLIWP